MNILRVTLALAWVLAMTTAALAEPTLGWSDIHDGGANLNDEMECVLFTTDGHVISGGMHDTGAGHSDLLIRKHDRTTGQILWSFSYAHASGNDMVLSELILDHRGDVMMAGYMSSCDS